MAGSVAAVGVLGASLALGLGLLNVGAASAWSQRLSGAADHAALAAADAASGAITGAPCERAARVADTAGAVVASCEVDGLVATVTLAARFGVVPATATARAGPPPAP
ncbi:helicase [Microbacterium sp. Sa4CUA7]|uniref:Helicase n=1 Tax=Microbacterium pullorum TaxID=2762236 RepID=A0ABR8RYI6_9MICO|nr:Rv3654c family TadE-like protein [Microbacterium pullorum]MBD7956308.1 helicase [Microbacterium pullorum]